MYQHIIKRGVDIIISILLLPLLLIVFFFVFLAIKLEDRGPVLFNGVRIGKDQKLFKMFKFRSMKVNAPDIRNSDGTTFNSSTDDRVTKVGKFMRKTSIDELPQFINVLIGDMSFVGPRPSPKGDKSIYPVEFFDKFKVRPGITGFNQATQRNNATMLERIKNDSYYVENLSFFLDIYIIWKTIKSVLVKKDIYRND